jgi:hypothetical protein
VDNSDSTIVTLYADRTMQIRDAPESLRLFKAFVMLSAARRRDIVDTLESAAFSLLPKDLR